MKGPKYFYSEGVLWFAKYFYSDVNVVGTKFQEDKSCFEEANIEDTVYLVPEPDNQYDEKAILVTDRKKHTFGYIPKGKIQDMVHDWDKRDEPYYCYISNLELTQIAIVFYCNHELSGEGEIKRLKLTSNTNQEMQDAIDSCSEGDSVDFTYDYEKEKLLATAIDDIGYLNKQNTEFFDNKEILYSYISDISGDGYYDKYSVTVDILYEE